MPELTQEQIDQMIAEKVAEARAGLFTEDELSKRVTSEVDRRVESGIQKGLETQRKKWEQDFSERAKLTAEELAKKDFEEKMQGLSQKEKEIQRKANLTEAKDLLADAQIPKSHYDKFIGILVSDDPESTKANIQNFIDVFNTTKTEIENKVKAEYSKIPQPSAGPGDEPVTQAKFNAMSYSQKLEFKAKHPDLYKEFIK